MFIYEKKYINNIKNKFNNIELIEKNYSQALQDMFVLSALNGKKNGTYLEIGADDPFFISNTFLLESVFDWDGISIDMNDGSFSRFQNSGRKNKFLLSDALKVSYKKELKKYFKKNRIDYLSLDIEPNTQTLKCLELLPLDDYRFSVITFETDFYDKNSSKENNDYVREKSREILMNKEYELVCGNLSNLNEDFPFEDWYLDKSFFDEKDILKFKRNSDNPIFSKNYMFNF